MPELWLLPDTKGEWLHPLDIAASVACQNLVDNKTRVLEIGIWKGSWSISILKNSSRTHVTGVDPYPNLARIRNQMIDKMMMHNVYDRFKLFDSIDDIPTSNEGFGLIHIDGEHSEKQTYLDLVACSELLSEKGIVILDDINVEWFPGVSSAMHKFMLEYEFRMFMTTKGKAYLSRKKFAKEYYSKLLISDLLADSGEIYQSYPSNSYEQSTSVFDQEVLIYRPRRVLTQE